ncbi:MAG: hypothetical protein ACE363_05245 [Alphaproteobacteria bacterium]
MFASVRTAMLGIGAVSFLGIGFAAGPASAGTVNIDCYCDPATDTVLVNGTEKWCRCDETQGLSGWATNEFRRRCKISGTHVNWPDQAEREGDPILVNSIPKGVTCTYSTFWNNGSDYYVFNDCTNWNTTTRHVSITTWCYKD